ncbi:MAG: PAS domain-containing protein [Acidobacteria bacterium]|nr:PAS domain-containing protein [Acidobacteriota bacterium]
MVIWWGPDLILLYNDGWRPILGENKDRIALGSRGQDIWPEVWDVLGPMFKQVLNEGRATWSDDGLLNVNRYGFTEEAYFTWSYSPIRDDEGLIGGVFTAVTETTARVIGERRLRTLRDLGEKTLEEAKTAEQACHAAADILAKNNYDFPFALIYLLDQHASQARLINAIGIDPATKAAPNFIDFHEGGPDPWNFSESLVSKKFQIIRDIENKFGCLTAGVWSDDVVKQAAVIPLAKALVQELPAGFLVCGISPRIAFEENYRAFLELAAGHIATGIANARALEEERRRAEALAEIDRAKTTFFSNISHELRTPLTLMLGPTEDALSKHSALGGAELNMVHRNEIRLLKLVNTLLDFSRIEAGRIEATFEPVSLAQLTTELASVFRSAIERAGLHFTVDCPELSKPVFVDREMWEKIVLNLISNALKSTFVGEIAISLKAKGHCAELMVRDTGTGIPREQLAHVFERFHRVEGARRRTHEGSGIGLALVQELVKMHGGSVTVESEIGVGTTFLISIPFGSAHLPQNRITIQSSAVPAGLIETAYLAEARSWLPGEQRAEYTADATPSVQSISSLVPRGTRKTAAGKVLLVDDNRDMREYLARLLSTRYEVSTAENGKLGVERALDWRPDLILSDIMMPEMDGYGLVGALRKEVSTSTLPIILLSARAEEEAALEGLERGADDYLVKPFTAKELIARVSAHLTLARVRRESEERLRESEERMRLFIQNAPAGIAMFDKQMRYLAVSDRWIQDYGLARNVLGRSHYEIFPEIPDRWREAHRRGLAGESLRSDKDPFLRADGTIQWIKWEIHPWHTASGEIGGIMIAAEEVSAWVQAAQALKESEQRFLQLAETIPQLAWMANPDGWIFWYNRRWYEYTGTTPEQMEGWGWQSVHDPKELPNVLERWRASIASGTSFDMVFPLRGGDGVFRPFLTRIAPLTDEHGKVVRWFGTNTDISERIQAEEALRNSEKLAAMGRVAAILAHEVNNPLEAVTNSFYLLRNHPSLDAEIRELTQMAETELARVNHIVKQTLAFYRQSEQPTRVSLKSLLDDLLEIYARQLYASRISLEKRFTSDGEVLGFAVELRQVFVNLIGNAVQAMPSGGKLRVHLYSSQQRNRSATASIRVNVVDTGTGILPQHVAQLFQPFFTTKGEKGTGLGLWVSRGIIQKMDGTIRVRSCKVKERAVTCFSVLFPHNLSRQ